MYLDTKLSRKKANALMSIIKASLDSIGLKGFRFRSLGKNGNSTIHIWDDRGGSIDDYLSVVVEQFAIWKIFCRVTDRVKQPKPEKSRRSKSISKRRHRKR